MCIECSCSWRSSSASFAASAIAFFAVSSEFFSSFNVSSRSWWRAFRDLCFWKSFITLLLPANRPPTCAWHRPTIGSPMTGWRPARAPREPPTRHACTHAPTVRMLRSDLLKVIPSKAPDRSPSLARPSLVARPCSDAPPEENQLEVFEEDKTRQKCQYKWYSKETFRKYDLCNFGDIFGIFKKENCLKSGANTVNIAFSELRI